MSKVRISNNIGTVENEYPGDGLTIAVDGVQCYPPVVLTGAAAEAGKPLTVEFETPLIVMAGLVLVP